MKRALVVALLILPVVGSAQTKGEPWTCGKDDIPEGAVLCAAAPEPGTRRYITDVFAQSTTATADVLELVHGKAVALGGAPDCGEDTTGVFFEYPSGTTLRRFVAAGNGAAATTVRFSPPLIVPAGRDFCVSGGTNDPITIQVVGYIAP